MKPKPLDPRFGGTPPTTYRKEQHHALAEHLEGSFQRTSIDVQMFMASYTPHQICADQYILQHLSSNDFMWNLPFSKDLVEQVFRLFAHQ